MDSCKMLHESIKFTILWQLFVLRTNTLIQITSCCSPLIIVVQLESSSHLCSHLVFNNLSLYSYTDWQHWKLWEMLYFKTSIFQTPKPNPEKKSYKTYWKWKEVLLKQFAFILQNINMERRRRRRRIEAVKGRVHQ